MRSRNRRQRGTGTLWQPRGSAVWWCAFYHRRKRHVLSTGERNQQKAKEFLNNRLAEVRTGLRDPNADRLLVDDLVDALLLKYRNDGNASLDDDERRWELRLKPFFGRTKVGEATTELLRQYVAERRKQPFKKSEHSVGTAPRNATINRELALLRASFHLARKSTPPMVTTVPFFPMLDESDNVRKGFLNDQEVQRFADACSAVGGLWLRGLFEIGVAYGWRISEPRGLRVRQIDFAAREINLEKSKNGDGRTVPILYDNLLHLLKACCEGKQPNELVFTRTGGSGIGKGVQPVRTFYKLWRKVTEEAGLPGLLYHDLRRTAIRNMRRLGIPESVAMKISGHRTRSVFDRYDIVNANDLKEAVRKIASHREDMSKAASKPKRLAKDWQKSAANAANGKLDESSQVQ